MLTFTNPSLLPLLALLVPLAIHLWNRRPGREVAVGSLRWLTAGANRRLRNLRLEQWPLLLLRLLLLAGLVGALAGPAWRPRRTLGRGQVLLAPALAGSPALAAERPRLDSLRRRGYGLRWLAPGLPRISPGAWRADSLGAPADSILKKDQLSQQLDFYAERIRLAADSLAGQPLYVLTPAALRGSGGTRRPLPAGVVWRTLPLAAQATWLQAATSTPDSLRLLLGQGNERQTTYRTVRLARPQPGARLAVAGLPPLRYQAGAGHQGVHLQPVAAGQEPAVPVQAAALRVWVYAPAAQAAEARTLRAALRAAALGLPGPLTLTVAATPPATAQVPDWLFWLADAPAPTQWRGAVRRGLRLWQFPVGAGRPDTTHLTRPELTAPVAVWRRAAGPAPTGQPQWRDGLGQPVLTAEPLGQGTYYRFATRLLPSWSELAASPDLPALLLDVLRPAYSPAEQQRQAAHDPRRLDPGQVQPPAGAGARRPAPAFGPPLDLRPWLVLAGLLLFGLERGLAARAAQPAAPSPMA
ncbi:MAG: BatA domain-containing protein [Janthinobacterium lividum]